MIGTFTAVAVYVAFNILLGVALAINVVRLRYRTRTAWGDGGHRELEAAIRAHGNNAEYAALALPALILLALLDAPSLLVHAIGLFYSAGRCLMAWVLGWNRGRGSLRQVGMALTLLSLVLAAAAIVVLASELDT